MKWVRGRVGKMTAKASVNGAPVADGEFTFAIADESGPAR
jgi:hypothetical protein